MALVELTRIDQMRIGCRVHTQNSRPTCRVHSMNVVDEWTLMI